MNARRVRIFDGFALFTLAYTMLVILWGAWVRITGSGAGCGQHWPTCHGEIIPTAPSMETFIEFFHRVTSGLAVLVVIALLVLAVKTFPKGHLARRGAWLTFIFILIECLIGAALVVFALVGDNDSATRAILMAIHLVNTSLLTGVMLLAVWWARRNIPLGWSLDTRLGLHLAISMGVLMLINASGAVTALGDTLYPIRVEPGTGLIERLDVATLSTRNFLIQMRIWHPFIAVAGGIWLIVHAAMAALGARRDRAVRIWAGWVAGLVAVQLVCGVVNILLGAPGWMQILHLFLAKGVWLAWVWFGLHALRHAQGYALDEEGA
ncbi:MAG: heme A synthase [Deltaproteobacteria bacterium]|nr:MAG: heme A synthase [Deltaproteobacteria bacterium]